MSTRLTLSVVSSDPESMARAVEHFARTATGMALDGVECLLVVAPEEES